MTTPYTYLIGWSNLDTYYYGRRTAQGCNPRDLWVTYFTSSPSVHQFVTDNGPPDIIQVRQIYDLNLTLQEKITKCVLWENKFLERVNAASNPKFLNKSNGDSKFDSTGMVTVIDRSTNKTKQITKIEFETNPNNYYAVRLGKVTAIILATNEITLVSSKEYKANRHLYRHVSEGIVTVTVKSSGEKKTIFTTEFYNNRHLYQHHSEGRQLTPDHVQKIKDRHTGVAKSESHKQNISKALTGYKKTSSHIQKIHKNRKKPFKPVIVNGIHFESVSGAAAHFDVNHSAISNFLAGRKRLSARFWEVRYA